MKRILAAVLALAVVFTGASALASDVPNNGDLKLVAHLTYSEFEGDAHYCWRGTFDYYLTDYWSFSGTSMFSLGKAGPMLQHLGDFGLVLHPFHVGNVEFYGGGGAGYTWVLHDTLPDRLVPTVTYRAGWALHAYPLCVSGEVVYKHAGYYAKGRHIDLNELVFSGGVGINFSL